jgi:hypothetical protein
MVVKHGLLLLKKNINYKCLYHKNRSGECHMFQEKKRTENYFFNKVERKPCSSFVWMPQPFTASVPKTSASAF